MWKSKKDYIIQDELGRWINTEFPPDSLEKYQSYSGYRNLNRETIFYQYSLMYYDVIFDYKGKRYRLVTSSEGNYVADEDYERLSEIFNTGNDLIKEYRFPDGKGLLDIVDDPDLIMDIY